MDVELILIRDVSYAGANRVLCATQNDVIKIGNGFICLWVTLKNIKFN